MWVTKSCPHCRAEISRELGLGADSTIGPPIAICDKCGNPYRTGKSEWSNKSTLRRLGYFLRVLWQSIGGLIYIGIGGVFVLALINHFLIGWSHATLLWIAAGWLAITLLLVAIASINGPIVEIRESRLREQSERQ